MAANWKMNKTIGETHAFLSEFIPLVRDMQGVEIVIAPPFTSLPAAAASLKGSIIKLSAQNVFYEERGAYTGEVSPAMLIDVGCTHVIIGHSERRQYLCETDEMVNRKIKVSLKHELKVIFCIGESLEERESGKTFDIVKRELKSGLSGMPLEDISVAYEPIWAIGTGKTATPEQAQEVHRYIREQLSLMYGEVARETRILYGGSVTPDNVDSLMECADVDGALVGGSSLKADSFARIVRCKR